MSDNLLKESVPMRRDFFEKQAALLEALAKEGQSPQALVVGCSDSRVSPEQLLGAQPGDLFMLRNIANIIPPYEHSDMGITAVLEYAVRHLRVPHLAICGHTDCGGIKSLEAELDAEAEPALVNWLEFARPAQQGVPVEGLNAWGRHRAVVEQNVVLQLRHAQTYPFVLAALEANRLELHGWVYYLRRRLMGYYDPARDGFVMG
ncbi:MAG: carbonic anhydrase [Anaerolineae bacterium]|nr:carbonic anhydrase [Anaerolineae bacterium]